MGFLSLSVFTKFQEETSMVREASPAAAAANRFFDRPWNGRRFLETEIRCNCAYNEYASPSFQNGRLPAAGRQEAVVGHI
jgi:hypothetical protein